MGSAKTKVRIFSIGLTSVLITLVLGAVLRSGIVIDYNTIMVMVFTMLMATLVLFVSMYAGLILYVEGLLLKWGNKVFESQKKDNDDLS